MGGAYTVPVRTSLLALCLLAACSAPTTPPLVEDAGTADSGASTDAGDQPDSGSTVDAGPVDAGASDGGVTDAGAADAGRPDAGTNDGGIDPLIRARPYELTVPPAADGGTALPLVVLLHGYGVDAAWQDLYFGFSPLARQRGFLLALPNGTTNAQLQRFWNATNACCGFGATVDDVTYLTAVIDDVARRYPVDPKKVFIVGHSNGGFMANRMACDRASKIAAFASVSGAQWKDESRCTPSEPVSALQLHGTFDTVVLYGGGYNFGIEYPGAVETIATWATLNGCQATTQALTPDVDLVIDALGAETTRTRHNGCPATGTAELWAMSGAPHAPTFTTSWAGAVYDWLLAHGRP